MTPPATAAQPGAPEIRAQLERILDSAPFRRSRRMQAFLRYIVEQTLRSETGGGSGVKGITISTEVFGRDPMEDSQAESQVRVEARRLRDKLEEYYADLGVADPVVIEVPRGSYVPRFRLATGSAAREHDARAGGASESRRSAALLLRRDMALVCAVLLVTLIVAGTAALMILSGTDDRAPPSAVTEIAETAAIAERQASIAVMPFKLLSDRTADRFVSDGLTDEIITGLTRHEELFVVAWDTAQHFQENGLNIRELGVRVMLDGSLRRLDEERLRVTARLTDTDTRGTLWSDDFDRISSSLEMPSLGNEIIGRIVSAVAKTFSLKLDPNRLVNDRVFMDRRESYECFLHALAYAKRPNPGDHADTRRCLERTVIEDPLFGKAWAALSFAYIDEVRFGFNRNGPPRDALDRSAKVALRAIELAPRSALARRALMITHFLLGNGEDFERAGRKALELFPGNSLTLADFGTKLAISGQWDRGIGLVREAIRLNPAYPDWYRFAFFCNHYVKGRDQEALTHALLIDLPDYPITHMALAAVYGQLELQGEARAALDRLLTLLPDFADSVHDYIAVWNFDPSLAERLLEGLVKAGLPAREGS